MEKTMNNYITALYKYTYTPINNRTLISEYCQNAIRKGSNPKPSITLSCQYEYHNYIEEGV